MEPEKYHIDEYPKAFQQVFNEIIKEEIENNISISNSVFNNISIYELKDYDIMFFKSSIVIKDFSLLCNQETNILQENRELNIPISIFKVGNKISNFPEHMLIFCDQKSSKIGTKTLFSIDDFLEFLDLFENLSQDIYKENSEISYGIRIGLVIRELLKMKSKTLTLRINRPVLVKEWSQIKIDEFNPRNHIIRLDLFLMSILEKKVIQKTLKLKLNTPTILSILKKFVSSLKPEIFVSDQINAIFPIIQAIVRLFKSQNASIYRKWNACYRELISILNNVISYFVYMIDNTIIGFNYETLSHTFFILRFMFKNFQYPYNSFFNMSNTNFPQALIFHEMVHFSAFPKELLNKLFFDQENDRIPFLTDDYYLCDIFGNKYSFVQTSGVPFKTISSNEQNYLTGSFHFNYFPGMTFVNEVVSESYNISYTIPKQLTIIYQKKILGSTGGFVIEVKSLGEKIEHLYVKELFCYSQHFATNLEQRIRNVGKRDILMSSYIYYSQIVDVSINEKELFFIYHNDPYVEMFSYLLLESMNMCPKFELYRSVFDLKTYIIMKEIENYQFCNLTDIELMIKDCNYDTMYESMKQFHKLQIFHSIFCFNDFNDQNYALDFEGNTVKGISLVDVWPCPYFLSVSELFHKIHYSTPKKIIEAFYNRFNQVIPEDEATIIYSKLTLSCFSTIVKFLSKEVDLTEIYFGKKMSSEILKTFLEDKIRFLENNHLASNQLNHFVIEAYKTHVLYNIAQMFSYFCSDNDRYLVNMIFDLLDFEQIIYVNGHYALHKVTKTVIESQFQQGSKIEIILYPYDKKREESLILNINQCQKKVIVVVFKDDDDFRSNIVNLDVIRCFLESIGFVIEYKFVPM